MAAKGQIKSLKNKLEGVVKVKDTTEKARDEAVKARGRGKKS